MLGVTVSVRAITPGLVIVSIGIVKTPPLRNGAAIAVWGGASARVVWIGCANNGVVLLPITIYIQALAIYDCTLTGPQVLAVATAMAAL